MRKFCFFSPYYPAIFMDKYSFMCYLFDSQRDEDADGDDDGADNPSVVLPTPTTPAPLVTSAASVAPPATPLVSEVNEILSGQYYLIIIVNSNSIQPVVFVFLFSLNHINNNIMSVLFRSSSSIQFLPLSSSSCTTS